MAVEKTLDKEIQSYLPKLNTEQKMALLGVLRRMTSIDEDSWNEQTFTREMNRRLKELKSGEIAGVTLQMMEDDVKRLSHLRQHRAKKRFTIFQV
jgi:hypothetical protein